MANNASLYAGAEKGTAVAKNAPKNDILARYWREVERYKRATQEWYEEADQIEKLYLDEIASSRRRFALLWSNVQTLAPAVYPKMPTVLCARRYKDKDPIARTCAELMERASNTSFDLYDANSCFKMVRDDRLISGRGQGWVRYEATIEQTEEQIESINNDTGEPETIVNTHEKVKSEKVCNDYVHWRDFGHNVGRTWAGDVFLVWREVYMREDEAADRFGPEQAAKLAYTATAPVGDRDGKSSADTVDNCARIYEFWDKTRQLTSWAASGHHDFLESGAPPISFRNFFPCPEPIYATKTSKQLVPVPDYRYYRDQAREINDLTDKIHRLTEWLIVKGFVPAGPSSVADPIEEVLRDKSNAEMFAHVESWKEWTDRDGAKGMIDWFPIDAVVQAIQAAIQARAQLVQDVYQLTGVSDILRGQTDPNETLGAQELKAQTGSRRLKDTKDDIARWCKDMAQLNAEVIAEMFQPQSIAEITGYKYQPQQQMPLMLAAPQGSMPGMAQMLQYAGQNRPMTVDPRGTGMSGPQLGHVLEAAGQGQPITMQPQGMMGHNGGPQMHPQMGDDAGGDENLVFDDRHMELLRNDKLRSFRIDVETDQTGQADENLEKQRRMELLTGVSGFLESLMKIPPSMIGAAKETFMFTMRSFRVGRSMEEALERHFDAAIKEARQMQAQQAQQGPDPAAAAAAETAKAEIQIKHATAQATAQIAATKVQTDAQLAAKKQQTDAQLAVRKQNIDAALKARDTDITAATAQAREKAERLLGTLKPTSTRQ